MTHHPESTRRLSAMHLARAAPLLLAALLPIVACSGEEEPLPPVPEPRGCDVPVEDETLEAFEQRCGESALSGEDDCDLPRDNETFEAFEERCSEQGLSADAPPPPVEPSAPSGNEPRRRAVLDTLARIAAAFPDPLPTRPRSCAEAVSATPVLLADLEWVRAPMELRGVAAVQEWRRTPELNDLRQTGMLFEEQLQAALNTFEGARHLAVFHGDVAAPTSVLNRQGTFTPGVFDGWLVIFDIATAQPLCQAPMSGHSSDEVLATWTARQPQEVVSGSTSAGMIAIEEDFARVYVRAATDAATSIAPGATLRVEGEPRSALGQARELNERLSE